MKEFVVACRNGDLEEVKRYSQDVDTVNASVALRMASFSGHLEIVQFLLKVKTYAKVDKDVSLCLAASGGFLDIMHCLLNAGADATADNNIGLRWALERTDISIVQCLLENGSQFNPEWDEISDDMIQVCLDFKPLNIKSAAKLE